MGYTHDAWGYPRRSKQEYLVSARIDIKIRLERELSRQKNLDPVNSWSPLIFAIIFLLLANGSEQSDRDEGMKECEEQAGVGAYYLENCRNRVDEDYTTGISSTNSICGALCILPALVLIAASYNRVIRRPEEHKLAMAKREQIMERLKSEIEKLEKPDPDWSRVELGRLESLKRESEEFRKSDFHTVANETH